MSEPCERCGLPVVKPLHYHEEWRCVDLLKRELAAIRLSFPEGHPARTEGSIAVEYVAGGTGPGLVIRHFKGQRDTARELLRKARKHIPDYGTASSAWRQECIDLHQRITAALGTPEKK